MFTMEITFSLLLLCAAVLCDDGQSYMERLLAQHLGQAGTTTARPVLKGCDLGSIEGSNGRPGVCVRESLCQRREKEGRREETNVDPATLFVPRDLDSSTLPFDIEEIDPDNPGCSGFLEVCCILSNVLLEPKVKPKPATKPIGCGFSNPGANTFRGIKGLADYSDFAEFPWMVALMSEGDAEHYLGGGTIIHPSVVMTAAHKVGQLKPNQLKCRAGELNLAAEDEIYKQQERSVSSIIVHPEYMMLNMQYGVALLILSSPFDLRNTPHIGVACLEPQLPRLGTTCYSMGWGRDYDGRPRSDVLKRLTLPLVQHTRCESLLRKLTQPNNTLHHTLLCAGGEEDVDTCFGDGGSPLVCPIGDEEKTRYSVVGMVAYGFNKIVCGKKDEPGVYIKVPAIYDWVVNEMSYLSFNTSAFVY